MFDFLKNPERNTAIGALHPKGCCCGPSRQQAKTLLSKAVAGEAEVPFFIISGSDSSNSLSAPAPLGARTCSSKQKKAPCNHPSLTNSNAIGKSVPASMGVGRSATKRAEADPHQLLTEMDGFCFPQTNR